jgi:RNA-binding protein 39
MRVIKPVDPLEQQQEIIRRQTKVVVGGLIDNLAEMQESELKELFEPFGEIEYVDIHRDPQTGRCKGFAFIQYANTECAKAAVKDMHNLVIRKQKISVQTVNVAQRGEVSASDEFIYSAGTKANLMNKLNNGMSGPSHSNLQRPPISTVTTPYLIMTNMFKM